MNDDTQAPDSRAGSMESWIITGGVACGKSTVTARLLESLGEDHVSVFSCDDAVHELYQLPAVIRQIVAHFGAGVLGETERGGVDRRKLGALVFGDKSKREALEVILHPPVLAALEKARSAALESGTVNLFVAEVPLYHEIGETVAADQVIVVASSPDQQVRRLMQHRGLDRAQSESMVGAQWPILDKVVRASKIIWNDGSKEALDDQISCLLSALDPT